MKKVLLFSVFVLIFCFMTGCGDKEQKTSSEDIFLKVSELYRNFRLAHDRGDKQKAEMYLVELLKHQTEFENHDDPRVKLLYYLANQRMGILQYMSEKYSQSIPYFKKALQYNLDDVDAADYDEDDILNEKLMMQIGLASVYDKLGDSEKRDSYLNLAEKRIKLLESREERYSEYILEHFFFYYTVKSQILQSAGKHQDALNALLKLKELFKYETANVDSLYPFVIQYFGKYYYRRHEYKEALKYFKEVFDMLVNNHKFPTTSYIYAMKILLLDKAYPEALFLSEKALETAKQKSGFFPNKRSEALLFLGIGKIYDAMNEKEKADHYKTLAGNLYPQQALEERWSMRK